jgi:HTH-type transcriptional regulator/antitoxin HigA
MSPKILKTVKEYKLAMARLSEIFDAPKGSPQGDELELLSLLIDKYEQKDAETYLGDDS